MEPSDIIIETLKGIRDEARKTNERLDQTNERLDQTNECLSSLEGEVKLTNERLEATNERLDKLERRQVESEVRLSTALTGVLGALEDVKTLLRENYSATVKDHERRITILESRAI